MIRFAQALASIVFALVAAAGPRAVLASGAVDAPERRVARAFIAALPAGLAERTLAVGEITGDDGRLREALELELAADARFVVVTRERVEALLREQGEQVKVIFGAASRVRLGSLTGAEALVLGTAVWSDIPGRVSLDATLQLVSVETGRVLGGAQASAVATKAWWTTSIAAALAAGVILAGALVLGLRARAAGRRRVGGAREDRRRARASAEAATSTLIEVGAMLQDGDDRATWHDARHDAEGLVRRLQEAPSGAVDFNAPGSLERMSEADAACARAAELLRNSANAALAAARGGLPVRPALTEARDHARRALETLDRRDVP